MPMMFGATPADPHDTSRTSGSSPSSAAFSGVVTMHIDAASFCPLALPAVTVASGSSLPRTGLSLARDSTEVSARGCSSVSMSSLALPGAHRDRDDLLGEDAVLLRGHRPLMRCHRQLVLFGARDAVLAAQVLGGLQHPAGHRIVPPTRGGPAAGERVVHLHAVRAPPQRMSVE